MEEEINDYLQALSDSKSDYLHYSLPGNVLVKSFMYLLRSGDSLTNDEKMKFLDEEFFLELMAARDRLNDAGCSVEIEVTAKFKITPPVKEPGV